jgi:site-specific DNA recombinase
MAANERKFLRCAVYTRKSSENGLEKDFNSLDAQREAAEAYIKSQTNEGWRLVKSRYDDGGQSGGTLGRLALQRLLADIKDRKVDVVVVYKVDRLTRSLADFAKLVELFESHGVSFVAVTQQFNTTTSMGRLTLNVLLSFAQFERELAGERIRDKFLASRRKGMWMGGTIPIGYDVKDRKLVVNQVEAERVNLIFSRYLELGSVPALQEDLRQRGVRSKARVIASGKVLGGCAFQRGALYHLLQNRVYLGEAVHKGISYPGEHARIIDEDLWNAVQAKLAGNCQSRRHAQVETGALLGGLIFDDRGNRMSPSYVIRRGNRHRYYVSRALVGGSKDKVGSRGRVGADAIDLAVVAFLTRHAHRKVLPSDSRGGSWNDEVRALVRDWIEKVIVGAKDVKIVCKGDTEAAVTENGAPMVHTVPLPPPPARARREILVPGGDGERPRRVTHALLLAVARARRWMEDLRVGRYADTPEIAAQFGMNKIHVRRLLRLNFLAPDILEAIIEGRQTRALTVKQLLRGIPSAWEDQRAVFGFAR